MKKNWKKNIISKHATKNLPRAIQIITEKSREDFNKWDEGSRKAWEYNHIIPQLRKCSLTEMSCGGNTIFHYAAQWNMPTVALFLIKNGVDINAQNFEGNTALHIGVYFSNLDVIKALINSGANSTLKNDEKKTALLLAAESMNPQMLSLLTEASPSPANHVDEDGNTALHIVAKNNYADAISYLHNAGFNLNALNNQQRTPLHLAAANGANKSASELIKLGATLTPDIFGKTPLHYAIELENEEMIYLLAKQAESVLKKTPSGKTAYDSANKRLSMCKYTSASEIKLRRIVDYLGILIELPLVRENSAWAKLLAKNSTLIMQVPLLYESLQNKKTLPHPALILLNQRASAYTLQCMLKKIQTNKKLYDCKICFKK